MLHNGKKAIYGSSIEEYVISVIKSSHMQYENPLHSVIKLSALILVTQWHP